MKFVVAFLLSSTIYAKESDCGKWDSKWYACKTVEDCVVIADECGVKRIVIGKANASKAQKIYECKMKSASCPTSSEKTIEIPIVKCEAYGVNFPGAKNVKPVEKSCLRLSDIVGMAINNGDLPRIESAINEAKDVDMSLSHIHETPLTLAALNAKTDVVEYLLKKGAKINFQTANGYTALMFVAGNSYSNKTSAVETAKLLLKSGADKKLKNSRGETALDQAKLVKNSDLINLLK